MDLLRTMTANLRLGAAAQALGDADLLAMTRQLLDLRDSDTFKQAQTKGRARLAAFGYDANTYLSGDEQQTLFDLMCRTK